MSRSAGLDKEKLCHLRQISSLLVSTAWSSSGMPPAPDQTSVPKQHNRKGGEIGQSLSYLTRTRRKIKN
eukprot:scaffold92604_cov30-Prasinocladus_malaysianus.AAC.1